MAAKWVLVRPKDAAKISSAKIYNALNIESQAFTRQFVTSHGLRTRKHYAITQMSVPDETLLILVLTLPEDLELRISDL